jgi:flavin reductase (DIM6/NTAB) family NADH-FMN oxidoreductase RutF
MFRQAAGRFASGVTVVSTEAPEGVYGLTVSSFASLSLNPLLVTVSVNRSSAPLGYVRAVQAFAVSVLASDQQQIARYFATPGRTPEPAGFSTVSTTAQQTGAPITASAGLTAPWRTSCRAATTRFLSAELRRRAVAPANRWSTGPVNTAQ